MAVFEYKALDASGKNTTGVIDADTAREARDKLRKQDIFATEMVSITEKKQKGMVGTQVLIRNDVKGDRKTRSGCPMYVEEAWPEREAGSGRTGTVMEHSNSHGLCFKVSFGDGTSSWYESDEIDLARKCDECGILYGDTHPIDECKIGAVGTVMES